MPGPLYHAGAVAICPHGGQVTVIPSAPRVLVSGMPVATMSDTTLVAACVFTVPPGKPQPCIRVQWLVPAARVLVNGQPALVQTSVGLCLSPESIPQGAPQILTTQTRVIGT
ncbi:MAG: hypothetical protein JWO56_2029 [Acidobacteria bacterium]|nr:hypothetical protein [Acidobacteriota bacterium]